MKTQSEQNQRWEDIIFEKRNKDYGAYAIRRSYGDNVITGWSISIGVVGLILLSSFISNEEAPPIDKKIDSTICVLPPPVIKPIEVPAEPVAPQHHVNQNLPPVATTRPVVDNPPTPVEPTPPSGEPGTGQPVDGNVASSGPDTGPPIEVPQPPPYVLAPEIMPQYEGGMEGLMKFLRKKVRYPRKAQEHHDEGTVYVSFIVNASGNVTGVEVLKGVSKECDQEAARVISLLEKWKPGMQNKMPVAVKMVLPIKFQLD